jgi:hypothetical protein
MIKLRWILALVALLVGSPALARQGYVQILSGTIVTTGAPERTGAAPLYQPDFGVVWWQPTAEFGTVNLELHAVRDSSDPRFGRGLLAVRDMKKAGLVWGVEFGDTTHTPYLTGYGFSNLFAPPVTFRGGTVSAVSDRTSFTVTAGRVTVFRDTFGADARALGQTIFAGRLTHRVSGRLQITAHASRVRTSDLEEFSYTIRSGDEAGAGLRYQLTPTWRVVADAGMTSYQRRDSTDTEHGPSALVGTQWIGARGAFEVNAHRFSPGEFSAFNYAYNDRDGVFASGQYTFLNRLRLDGAWELFRTNIETSADANLGQPLTTGSRARAGFRLALTRHLSFGARLDKGARRAGPSRYSVGDESDTGSASVDAQLTIGCVDAFGQYQRRSDVGLNGTSVTYTQHDALAHVLLRPTSRLQLSSSLQISERRGSDGSGQSFWQASAGGQAQLWGQRLFARAELLVSGNRDFTAEFITPRRGLNLGLNGRVTSRLSVTLDTYIDRSPMQAATSVNPWATRTLVRLVYTRPTGLSGGGGVLSTRPPGSPTGRASVEGIVFADWNGNGIQEPDEEALPGVTVVLDGVERLTTGRDGAYRFTREAAGAHALRADPATVSAEYDLPAASSLDFSLGRNERRAAAIGLLPLGDIHGTLFHDVNGNRVRDDGDTPVDNAVVILDDGRRTEVTRQGRFRFSGVQLGSHTVRLLMESLPDDAALTGPAEVTVEVSRQQRESSVSFLVQTQKRPEIRKVFAEKNSKVGGRQQRPGS